MCIPMGMVLSSLKKSHRSVWMTNVLKKRQHNMWKAFRLFEWETQIILQMKPGYLKREKRRKLQTCITSFHCWCLFPLKQKHPFISPPCTLRCSDLTHTNAVIFFFVKQIVDHLFGFVTVGASMSLLITFFLSFLCVCVCSPIWWAPERSREALIPQAARHPDMSGNEFLTVLRPAILLYPYFKPYSMVHYITFYHKSLLQ